MSNAAHAIAVLAEVGLGFALSAITEILPRPKIEDPLTTETTKRRIGENDGKWVLFCYNFGLLLKKFFSFLIPAIPYLCAAVELFVLFLMAFEWPIDFSDGALFVVSFCALAIIVGYAFTNAVAKRKTETRVDLKIPP